MGHGFGRHRLGLRGAPMQLAHPLRHLAVQSLAQELAEQVVVAQRRASGVGQGADE